ncbi:MAG TPA: hypothetical protein VHV08_10325, partial [Pirellulales bacterium]|nr:hypothetical protein [Pirellulales bacterium]
MNRQRVAIVLALAMVASFTASVNAQVRPQRTAQRDPPIEESQQPASDARSAGAVPRANSGSAPSAAGAASSKGAATGAAQGRRPEKTAAPQNPLPETPFALNESEQQLLDQILIKWERQSDKVKSFKCVFTRWEYDPTWGDPQNKKLKTQGEGTIKFKSPDRGEYTVTNLTEYDFNKAVYSPQTENLDRWVCDGKSIFEFDT